MQESIPVKDIVAHERCRKELTHIAALAESIRKIGLLHPIVVNGKNELLAGGRRLAAVKSLKWTEVPIRRVETASEAVEALMIERDENTCREPLAMLEVVELGKRIEAMLKPEADKRKKASQAKPGERIGGDKLSPPVDDPGKVRDKVAAAVGVSGMTFEKAKAVVAAAEKEPEKFGPVAEEMNRTGNVSRAYKQVKKVNDDPLQAAEEYAKEVGKFMRLLRSLRDRMSNADERSQQHIAQLLENTATQIMEEAKALRSTN